MNSAQQLLAGSDALNRMQKEIPRIITTLFGFLGKYCTAGSYILQAVWTAKIISPTDCDRWEISRSVGGFLSASYYQKGSDGCWVLRYIYSSAGGSPPRLEDVAIVHRALDGFVDGMLREFPELQRATQPLFDAAKRLEETA